MALYHLDPDNRFYFAEWMVHKMGLETHVADPQAFLEHMQGTRFFRNRWPGLARRNLEVRESKEARWASADLKSGIIRLPPWAYSDYAVIHELCHFIAPPRKQIAHHGRFAAAELLLVKKFMSPEAHRCLYHSLQAMDCPIGI